MATTFVPLELGLIDEGECLQKADQALGELQGAMMAYRAEHGDQALAAKGSLTLKVTLAIEAGDQTYSIKAQTTQARPAPPATVSLAFGGESQDAQPRLLVRQSGSDARPPAQAKLCTNDGRRVDAETGEVLDE